MALTDLELIRLTISDPVQDGFDDLISDGDTEIFRLAKYPVVPDSATVTVNNDAQVEDTDFTLNDSTGLITFATSPASGDNIEVKYQYTVFSDNEINEFLAIDDSVDAVVLRLIDILLFDSARRFNYSAGQTKMEPAQVFQNLKELRKIFADKITTTSGSNFSIGSRSSKYYTPTVVEDCDLTRRDDI